METKTPFRGHAVPSGVPAQLMAPVTGPLLVSVDRRDERQGVRRTQRHATSPLISDYPVNGKSLRAFAPAGPAAPPVRRSSHPGDPT